MASNDSTSKTLLVAFLLCIVCSIIVSTAAVSLRPVQEKNKLLDKQENILSAAGLLEKDTNIAEAFKNIETRYVDLETGEYVEKENYDQRKAAKDPERSIRVDPEDDIASIKRRAKVAEVYLAKNDRGEIETVIFPVHGYGLWSTLYGFIALETDLNTVVGLGFYEHGETPGLGGEVDNPDWKAKWEGKKVYAPTDEQMSSGEADGWSGASGNWQEPEEGDLQVALKVIKGEVRADTKNAKYKVDGLSGATLTSNGVSNLIQYWMGENGFGPFIEKSKQRGL